MDNGWKIFLFGNMEVNIRGKNQNGWLYVPPRNVMKKGDGRQKTVIVF